MFVSLILLTLVAEVYSTGCTLPENEPVVTLPMGRIRGFKKTIIGKDLDVFLGIPFAKPPLGELRYKKPLEIEKYKKEIIANSLPKACFQINPFANDGAEYYKKLNMSEDCLYLNIWVPQLKEKNTEPKSVLVWIYGGGFTMGSTSDLRYSGQVIAAHGEVIVASINYRVGAMGFLNGATRDEPGNIGLYDQALALRWIRNNIAYFGGNPETVTIFGESAGAVSVGYHLTSPFSKGLFKRGIIQSGTPNLPVYYDYDQSIDISQEFANKASCSSPNLDIRKNPNPILNCLRSKSPEELSVAEYNMRGQRRIYAQFRQVVGEDFIPYSSFNPLKTEHVNDHDFIIGITANEGSTFIHDYFGEFYDKDATKSMIYDAMIPFLTETGKLENVKEKLDHYFRGIVEDDDLELKRAMSDVLTDWMFKCPSQEFANLFAHRNNHVFYYYYNHVYSGMKNYPSYKEWLGVPHFEEVKFLFGSMFYMDELPFKLNFTKSEERFSLELIELWSSFAKNGVARSSRHYAWPAWEPHHVPVLQLNATTASVIPLPRVDRCRLWITPRHH